MLMATGVIKAMKHLNCNICFSSEILDYIVFGFLLCPLDNEVNFLFDVRSSKLLQQQQPSIENR